MPRVDRADGVDHPSIERTDDPAGLVGGLVDRVVAGHPGGVPVAVGDELPQVHGAVLEVPMRPEGGDVGRIVTVPVVVLTAGQGVQVDDRVDAVSSARLDHPVQVAEARLVDLERPVVVLEVAVVHRHADAVEPAAGEQSGVRLAEEDREQAFEEQLVPVGAEHVADGGAHEGLVGRVAGDEVLHVQPAAEAGTAQPKRSPLAVDETAPARPDLVHRRLLRKLRGRC